VASVAFAVVSRVVETSPRVPFDVSALDVALEAVALGVLSRLEVGLETVAVGVVGRLEAVRSQGVALGDVDLWLG